MHPIGVGGIWRGAVRSGRCRGSCQNTSHPNQRLMVRCSPGKNKEQDLSLLCFAAAQLMAEPRSPQVSASSLEARVDVGAEPVCVSPELCQSCIPRGTAGTAAWCPWTL